MSAINPASPEGEAGLVVIKPYYVSKTGINECTQGNSGRSTQGRVNSWQKSAITTFNENIREAITRKQVAQAQPVRANYGSVFTAHVTIRVPSVH
ncbi:hypothetical protein GCM10027577_20340 [Spirosoma fluminis]